MLVCFWSPKGGSGTSVLAATAAVLLAREGPTRLADLAGDQPAVLGVSEDPATGLRDWLRAGPGAPVDALDRLAVAGGNGLELLPAGRALPVAPAPEAGAALGVALRDDPRTTVVDAGLVVPGGDPAVHALVEVADVSVVVVRGCYLALRRAVRLELLSDAAGAVLVDEAGRSLGAHDVEHVLGIPVLATVELRAAVARTVDAGVLATRLPEALARPVRELLRRAGLDGEQAA